MAVTIVAGAVLTTGGAVVETSGGVKYAVFVDGNVLVVYKDIDGTPSLEDSDTAATVHGGDNIDWCHAALDSNDDICIVCACDADQTRDISYAVFDTGTDTLGAWAEAAAYTDGAPTANWPGCHITIDSSDQPHILYVEKIKYHGTAYEQIYHAWNDGSWNTEAVSSLDPEESYRAPKISVDSADDLHAYWQDPTANAPHYRKETSGSWGTEDAGGADQGFYVLGFGLAVDGTTPRMCSVETTAGFMLREGSDVDSLGDTGYDAWGNASIAVVSSTRYLFFPDAGDNDVHLISNDGGGWTDEGDLQVGSYNRVIAEWAYNNEHQSGEINYIFDDGSDVFYDSFALGVPPNVIAMGVADLTAGGESGTVVPGLAAVTMAVGELTAAGEAGTLVPGLVFASMATGELTSGGESATLVPGLVGVAMTVGELIAQGQAATVVPGLISITMATGELITSGEQAAIKVVARIFMATGELVATGEIMDLDAGSVVTLMATGELTAAGQILGVAPGLASALMGVGELTALGEAGTVAPGLAAILMGTGGLTASGEVATLAPGLAAVTMGVGELTASGEALSVTIAVIIQMATGELVVGGEIATVVPGLVGVPMGVGELTAGGEAMTLYAIVTIPMGAGELTTSGEGATIVPGLASVLMGVGELTIEGLTLTVSVSGAIQIAMATAELGIAGEPLILSPGAVVVPMATASLLATGESGVLVPGGVAIPMATGALLATGEALVVSPGGVAIPMATGALTAAGQAGIVKINRRIAMALASLTAGGQALAVQPGAVAIPMSTAALGIEGPSMIVWTYALMIDVDGTLSLVAAVVGSDGRVSVVTGSDVLIGRVVAADSSRDQP